MSFFAYNSFQRIIGDKLEKLSNPNMIAAQHDVNGMPVLILNLQYKFFEDSSARLNVLKVSFLIMLFVVIGIVLHIFSYNLIYCFQNFLKNDVLSFEFFLLTSCSLLLLNIPVFLVYSFTPFTLKKNEKYIRWNFLQTIYRKQGIWHPRSDLWLDKNKQD